MKYTVYEHKSNTSGKKYIGYTSLGLKGRLHKHYINAMSNMDTHFYKAIRKYGLDDFVSKILWEGYSKKDATDMEIHYIKLFDTFKTGYNSTEGGDGGWCVPAEKYDEWAVKISKTSTKEHNGRWCGYTDEEILECAHVYFSDNDMNVSKFVIYSAKEFNMPKSYSKNRFGDLGFKKSYCEKYNLDISCFKYKKTDEHKRKLSEANMNKRWYSNETSGTSKQFNENKQPLGWTIGRKYGY